MPTAGPLTSPVAPADVAAGFSSGVPALDRYFSNHALSNHENGIGATFVLRSAHEREPAVLGFYTLAMASVPAQDLHKHLGRNLPRYPMPVALLGRLAVHEQAQGRGLGQRLLGDALRRVLAAGDMVGCVGVIVDAKSEAAEAFYLRYGFVLIDDASWPHRLFLPTATIKRGHGS